VNILVSQKELSDRFREIKKLLCELRETFLRWVVIESDGVVPGGLLTTEIGQDLDGKRGLLRVVFHGDKCGCFFKLEKGKQVHWKNFEADSLSAYEEIVFSIWDYSTGSSLEKRSEFSTAEWYVDDQGTANRFEDIASKIDKLLVPLHDREDQAITVATISRATRNLEQPKWKPSRVYWGFVKNLDEAIQLCETKMSVTDVKEKTADGLEPKPPEFLQNLLWIFQNWKKHLAILILAGLVLGIFVWPKLDLFSKLFNSQKETPKTEVKTSGDSSNYGRAEKTISLTQLQESPVTIDEVFRTLKSDLLTDLQKSEFKNKHTGRVVTWTGYVSSIVPSYFNGFLVVFRPESQMKESFPDFVVAHFPQTAKADLLDLSKMDWVEIQGKLLFTDSGTVTLDDSKLIKWKKQPDYR
jgi:hypothetical protein